MLSVEELVEKGKEATKLSYSPYSHFAVGAAIELNDGKVILGANVENASYGLSMCAERVALYQMVMQGYTKDQVVQMIICCDCEDLPYPCGACRQVLSEIYPFDKPIYVANFKGDILKSNLNELLPYAFKAGELLD